MCLYLHHHDIGAVQLVPSDWYALHIHMHIRMVWAGRVGMGMGAHRAGTGICVLLLPPICCDCLDFSFTKQSRVCNMHTHRHTYVCTYVPPFLTSGGPLHLGDIEDIGYGESPRIRCPWHHWCFDLNNGRQVRPHYNGACTVSFPARITKDGKIEIGFNSLHSSYFTNSDF